MKALWEEVPLKNALNRVERFEQRDDLREYTFAGTYSFARGIFVSGRKAGSSFKLPKIQRVRAGDFVYCKIMAWEGAFGTVPSEADNCVMSGAFVVYETDKAVIEPKFLDWYFRSPANWERVGRQSTGTNVRRQSLDPEQFESTIIPLPPLDEQRRIVARIEELAAKVEEARKLQQEATKEAGILLSAELHRRFVVEENSWAVSTVGESAEIIDPNPSHRMPRYAEAGFPFISTVDFEGSEGIRRRTSKYVTEETYLEQQSRCSFEVGDILYSRIGTIGMARLLTEIWPFALSHVLVVVKPKRQIEPRFLLWYLRSNSITVQASEATRSTGVPDLGIKRIRSFHMPRPTLDEQRRIVSELDALQARVDSVKALQSETAAELRAMLPAILDRAFKGDL